MIGGADDISTIIDNTELNNLEDKKKEKIKKKKEKEKISLGLLLNNMISQIYANDFIEWFKENISDIFLFCFERGLSKNKTDWAQFMFWSQK